jgi:hypothetical protein
VQCQHATQLEVLVVFSLCITERLVLVSHDEMQRCVVEANEQVKKSISPLLPSLRMPVRRFSREFGALDRVLDLTQFLDTCGSVSRGVLDNDKVVHSPSSILLGGSSSAQ